MIPRSRSSRFAALTLAFTAPLAAAYAVPAFATGADLVTAVPAAGNVHVTSTKGLSKVTVVFCDGSYVVSDNWGNDQLTGDIDVDGVVRAVFVHSGSNTTTDAETLLTQLAGAGAVNGKSTGAVAYDDADACEPETPTPTPDPTNNPDPTNDPDPTSNPDPTPNSTPDPTPQTQTVTTASDPGPATAVLGVSIEKPAAPQAPTAVLAETASPQSELPHTGAGHMQPLVNLGLALLAAGLTLKAALLRRTRSASSPG